MTFNHPNEVTLLNDSKVVDKAFGVLQLTPSQLAESRNVKKADPWNEPLHAKPYIHATIALQSTVAA